MALRHTRQRSRQASSGSGNGSFGTTGVGTMPAIGKGESLHFRQAIRERVAAAKEPRGSVFGTRCCARLRYLRNKFEPIPRRSVKESRAMFAKPFVNALLPLTAALATAAGAQHGPAPAAKPATSTYAIPIGPSIGLDAAKRAATAASAEARKNGWFMAIAVVDPAGTLVYYEKAD